MPDYKEMYFKLFAAVADVHEKLEKIMQETEEMYINENKNNEILNVNFSDNKER